jgi:hypothetical protein
MFPGEPWLGGLSNTYLLRQKQSDSPLSWRLRLKWWGIRRANSTLTFWCSKWHLLLHWILIFHKIVLFERLVVRIPNTAAEIWHLDNIFVFLYLFSNFCYCITFLFVRLFHLCFLFLISRSELSVIFRKYIKILSSAYKYFTHVNKMFIWRKKLYFELNTKFTEYLQMLYLIVYFIRNNLSSKFVVGVFCNYLSVTL